MLLWGKGLFSDHPCGCLWILSFDQVFNESLATVDGAASRFTALCQWAVTLKAGLPMKARYVLMKLPLGTRSRLNEALLATSLQPLPSRGPTTLFLSHSLKRVQMMNSKSSRGVLREYLL